MYEYGKKGIKCMDLPIELLSKVDVPTILAMAAMFWFMNSRLDKKFDKIDQKFDKIDQRFEKVDQRFDRLDEKVTDIDRRLCRLEGAFASKDCCMIKDERQMKRVE